MNRGESVGLVYNPRKSPKKKAPALRVAEALFVPCLMALGGLAAVALVHQALHQIDILERLQFCALLVIDAA